MFDLEATQSRQTARRGLTLPSPLFLEIFVMNKDIYGNSNTIEAVIDMHVVACIEHIKNVNNHISLAAMTKKNYNTFITEKSKAFLPPHLSGPSAEKNNCGIYALFSSTTKLKPFELYNSEDYVYIGSSFSRLVGRTIKFSRHLYDDLSPGDRFKNKTNGTKTLKPRGGKYRHVHEYELRFGKDTSNLFLVFYYLPEDIIQIIHEDESILREKLESKVIENFRNLCHGAVVNTEKKVSNAKMTAARRRTREQKNETLEAFLV